MPVIPDWSLFGLAQMHRRVLFTNPQKGSCCKRQMCVFAHDKYIKVQSRWQVGDSKIVVVAFICNLPVTDLRLSESFLPISLLAIILPFLSSSVSMSFSPFCFPLASVPPYHVHCLPKWTKCWGRRGRRAKKEHLQLGTVHTACLNNLLWPAATSQSLL